jgi:hypothetical protein
MTYSPNFYNKEYSIQLQNYKTSRIWAKFERTTFYMNKNFFKILSSAHNCNAKKKFKLNETINNQL